MQVLQLSREGLERRNQKEGKFLAPLQYIADTGETKADALIAKFNTEWNQSVDPVYSPEFTY